VSPDYSHVSYDPRASTGMALAYAQVIEAATGMERFSSSEKLLAIGEKVNNLVRGFNIREVLTKELDTLPARFFKEPLGEGPCQGRVADLGQLLEEYYLVRGWSVDGRPTDQKLKELSIHGGR